MKRLLLSGLLMVLCGCASTVEYGGRKEIADLQGRVCLAPFENATDDEHAGRAFTELFGTAMMERGVELIQLSKTASEDPGAAVDYLHLAKEKKAVYLVAGAVHEYRYKTDLDGDPAVGVTIRIVEVSSKKTVWQASGSNVGVGFSSLTSAAQEVVGDIVRRMPWPAAPGRR
ncbi:MAG: hypothetical protein PHV34_20815 [Verrucomicrobiae bacterium]|nr:hypothetical protein [Verrucomicrobiae bacterium]